MSSAALRIARPLNSVASKPITEASSSASAPTNTPSSFFTPSLCRIRKVYFSSQSYLQASDPTPVTAAGHTNPPASSVVLDWNTFFRLRANRRRFSLASSIITSVGTTAGTIILISENPELGDNITKVIPTDPFIGLGIATFAATFFGWLIGPIFGNTIWRLFNRSQLPEFTIKEKAFFDRVKKHRVNPTGASTNNPVPDFYGEKVGSVAGYRRWLKDQRVFNRKKAGNYSA